MAGGRHYGGEMIFDLQLKTGCRQPAFGYRHEKAKDAG
jgi:hypothetical protein